jgi:hypothetical protein
MRPRRASRAAKFAASSTSSRRVGALHRPQNACIPPDSSAWIRTRDLTIMSRAPPCKGRVQAGTRGREVPARRPFLRNSGGRVDAPVFTLEDPVVDPGRGDAKARQAGRWAAAAPKVSNNLAPSPPVGSDSSGPDGAPRSRATSSASPSVICLPGCRAALGASPPGRGSVCQPGEPDARECSLRRGAALPVGAPAPRAGGSRDERSRDARRLLSGQTRTDSGGIGLAQLRGSVRGA